jgi:hypothetical protein
MLTSQNFVPAKGKEEHIEVPRDLRDSTNCASLGFHENTIRGLLEPHNQILSLALAEHSGLFLEALTLLFVNASDGG